MFFLSVSYNNLKKNQPQKNYLIISQLGTLHLQMSVSDSFQPTMSKVKMKEKKERK